ncbi:hypothetical protein [Haloarcula sp. 1CSR25-25]|uniref:hypothetical protein n=1 Tax=Haloarcula sp. 1CSR25-25 TaxID=2862545 RepID=UPI002895CEED|nr:hypothetical protein [Haloarcula sp. 1CSR25-25]MDT3437316.1 hypothetical protein [Haloarcula sp. 1CSR25-25]
MDRISKCYLIGAGASHGHSPDLSSEEAPPMRCGLFVDGYSNGLLRESQFEFLLEYILEELDIPEDPDAIEADQLCFDEEEFFNEIYQKTIPSSDADSATTDLDASRAIGSSFYYFYELFRRYSNIFSPQGSYYTDLALHNYDTRFGVISLNYDVMLEKSICYTGQQYHYPSDQHQNGIPIAKLHGTINLLNDFGAGYNTGNEGDFLNRVRHIVSNTELRRNIPLNFEQLHEIDYEDLALNFDSLHEPALMPPLGSAKDYRKNIIYSENWKAAEQLLEDIEELVVIGTSIADDDMLLVDLLESTIDSDVTVTIAAGGNSDEIRNRVFPNNQYEPIDAEGPYFSDYVNRRL